MGATIQVVPDLSQRSVSIVTCEGMGRQFQVPDNKVPEIVAGLIEEWGDFMEEAHLISTADMEAERWELCLGVDT